MAVSCTIPSWIAGPCRRHGPKLLTVFSLWWLFMTLFGTNYMLYDHIYPGLYGSGRLYWVIESITLFFAFQLFINWFFMVISRSPYVNSPENNSSRMKHEQNYPHLASDGIAYEDLRERRPREGTFNWSVVTQYKGSDVIRTAYPYWSWKPCVSCGCYKPPRCHHCPLCGICILKRDHHCFFAATCISLNNQRFFLVFNFWSVVLVTWVLPQYIFYMHSYAWVDIRYIELFLPWTIISYLIDWSTSYTLLSVFEAWAMFWFLPLAGNFLYEQIMCIEKGQTSHEREEMRDFEIKTLHKTRQEKYAAVFGERVIWLNWFIPLHWLYKPLDDGITWSSSIKME